MHVGLCVCGGVGGGVSSLVCFSGFFCFFIVVHPFHSRAAPAPARCPLPPPHPFPQDAKDALAAIDARPIKKVAEAKARKRHRLVERLNSARTRAEAIAGGGVGAHGEAACQPT